MIAYVLDDLALIAGLVGNEHERHALSRVLRDAIDGGPRLEVPAMCLVAAAEANPAVTDHLADVLALCAAGTVTVGGLDRTPSLDTLRIEGPWVGWPAAHAASAAMAGGLPILTTDRERYRGFPVDVLVL